MKFGSLFSGIGGIDLGLERAGMECAWQVEIDDYCRQVLARHWPDVERFGDVRECGKHNLGTVDLIAGGFPCQPFSLAGQQRGADDDRNLWPEMRRIIEALRPTWALCENVPGIIGSYLDTVLSDLEGEGYACWPFIVPACALDAAHRRERLFIVAYANSGGCTEQDMGKEQPRRTETVCASQARQACAFSYANTERWDRRAGLFGADWGRELADGSRWEPEPSVGRLANGVPRRVDRLRALGNTVVPQVAEWIGRRIMEVAA